MTTANQLKTTWLERIADSIEGLKYGHVQITIHDGKIVQIDRLERRRFDGPQEASAIEKQSRSKNERL